MRQPGFKLINSRVGRDYLRTDLPENIGGRAEGLPIWRDLVGVFFFIISGQLQSLEVPLTAQ